jgi:glycosyltransferase involved in cell wall biosynthesis
MINDCAYFVEEDKVPIIIPIHNEEKYLPDSLGSLRKFRVKEIIAILDRCTDRSEAIVKEEMIPNAIIIKKDITKWRNSYAKNLQIGYEHAKGSLICIHIGGFKDVLAPDTQLDNDLKRAGYASKLWEIYVWHLRKITLRRAISTQINVGRARKELHQPLWLVLGHSALSMRPFVMYRYLKGEEK